MCLRNRTHRVGRWLVIEENAAATVDLQVDEAGRKHRPGRHGFDVPVACSLIARRDALNYLMIDQDDRIIVPSVSIENTISRNCRFGRSGLFGWLWTHRLTSSLASIVRAELRWLTNVPEGTARTFEH